MKQEQVLKTVVTTLLSLGFRIIHTSRKPSYMALLIGRIDEFGAENKYFVACCEPDHTLSGGDVRSLEKQADSERASTVVIGEADNAPNTIRVMKLDEFLGRL